MLKALILVLAIAYLRLYAAEFCAVKILLVDVHGKPGSALVELRDASGKTIQEDFGENGEAQFCDFGFGEHSIRVGGTSCASVIIPGIHLDMGNPQTSRVYLNPCGSGERVLLGCRVYFRVTSQGIPPLPLAGVVISTTPNTKRAETDTYGRVQIDLSVSKSYSITFDKAGYSKTTTAIDCTKPKYTERSVRLATQE